MFAASVARRHQARTVMKMMLPHKGAVLRRRIVNSSRTSWQDHWGLRRTSRHACGLSWDLDESQDERKQSQKEKAPFFSTAHETKEQCFGSENYDSRNSDILRNSRLFETRFTSSASNDQRNEMQRRSKLASSRVSSPLTLRGSQILFHQRFLYGGAAAARPQFNHWNSSFSIRPAKMQSATASFFSSMPKQEQEKTPRGSNTSESHADSQRKFKVDIPSRKIARSKIPTPDSSPPIQENPLANLPEPKSIIGKGVDLIIYLCKSIVMFLWKLPGNIVLYTFNHSERNAAITKLQDMIKHEVNHYWVGTKLLWADVRTARDLLKKTLNGSSLTRRERKQLLRTVSDLFRLVPFSMFVIIPFMEFALPFALRIFPNLLPSTFQDSLKAEENMKREVKSRIAMAQFFQETLEELAKEQKRKARRRKEELLEAGVELNEDGHDTIDEQVDSAASMLEFLQKAQNGEMIPPDVIIRYAKYFQDDLTLDNMPRMQLINMCKYMGIPPYGTDAFLRFQLRHRIRVLKEDDQRILWEGIDSLTKMELREACQERGMRSTGLSKDAYKNALQQWLDLSVSKNVPISLLIMSRTFFLREDVFQPASGDQDKNASSDITGLADTISGLDKEVLNEVILQVATSEEKKSDPTIQKLKLAVLDQQNELIREEQEAREAAAALKKAVLSEKEAVTDSTESSSPGINSSTSTFSSEKETGTGERSEEPSTEYSGTGDREKENVEEEERDLSAEEMDALRQLLSDDPVSAEREDLAKLKATLKSEVEKADEDAEKTGEKESKNQAVHTKSDDSSESSTPPHEDSSVMSMEDGALVKADSSTSETSGKEEMEYAEDPLIQRLQKRIESMVDKIEVQLSDVQVKIGDKLHFLDKDRDGILSREEVASVLQQVFKRKITFEEAMEITDDMDGNQDGYFSVEELLRWIDETRLVKFVEEGREVEVDSIINQTTEPPKETEDVKQSKDR